MSDGGRFQTAILVLACCAVAAFVVSFVLGLRVSQGSPPDARSGEAPPEFVAEPAPAAAAERPHRTDGAASERPDPGMDEARQRGEIRVEVLNGAGRAGLAREATDLLIEHGFDVVYFGNARDFGRETSVVLDRIDDPAAALAVAGALGITEVRAEPAPELFLHASVILGLDWLEPPPPAVDPDWRKTASGIWQRVRSAVPF